MVLEWNFLMSGRHFKSIFIGPFASVWSVAGQFRRTEIDGMSVGL